MNDDLKELYMGHLGLNRTQVRLIALATMKRHYVGDQSCRRLKYYRLKPVGYFATESRFQAKAC
jgi:hypothetical protein